MTWVVESSKLCGFGKKHVVCLVAGAISEFSKVKQALEEHLLAINENSSEIAALFDYLQDVESKIECLSSRLDSLQLTSAYQKPTVEPLSEDERKVFKILYTSASGVSYNELAERICATIDQVSDLLVSLSSKGVKLSRQLLHKKMLVSLDASFKDLQAKENLVNLSLDTFF